MGAGDEIGMDSEGITIPNLSLFIPNSILIFSIFPYINLQEISEQSTHYFYYSILMVDTLGISSSQNR